MVHMIVSAIRVRAAAAITEDHDILCTLYCSLSLVFGCDLEKCYRHDSDSSSSYYNSDSDSSRVP
jgi:hypothetical protein